MTLPFRGDLPSIAASVVCTTVLGYVVDGFPLAAYSLLTTSVLGGMYVLWSRTNRNRRRDAVRADRRFNEFSDRIREFRTEQADGIGAVSRQMEHLETQLIRIADDLSSLREESEKSTEMYRRLEEIGASVERIPSQTRNVVRMWSRVSYAEIEDLLALYRDIDPGRSLPTMHGWAAGADLARFLYKEVTERRREHIVECGSGTTTVIFAYALRAMGAGRVTALEHLPFIAETTRKMLHDHGLDEWAEVVDAPLTDVKVGDGLATWYEHSGIPDRPIDLLFVDGPPGVIGPEARYPALPLLINQLAPDAAVVLDDANRKDERAIGERWQQEFPAFRPEKLRHDYGTLVLRRDT